MIQVKHKLKILKTYSDLHLAGEKNWELRKNDRNFKAGDIIEFTVINKDLELTGEVYEREIQYVYEGLEYGLKKGHCVLSINNK